MELLPPEGIANNFGICQHNEGLVAEAQAVDGAKLSGQVEQGHVYVFGEEGQVPQDRHSPGARRQTGRRRAQDTAGTQQHCDEDQQEGEMLQEERGGPLQHPPVYVYFQHLGLDN